MAGIGEVSPKSPLNKSAIQVGNGNIDIMETMGNLPPISLKRALLRVPIIAVDFMTSEGNDKLNGSVLGESTLNDIKALTGH